MPAFRGIAIVLSSLIFFSCGNEQESINGDLLITGAFIVDPDHGTVSEPRDLMIGSGEILEIAEAGAIPPARSKQTLEGSGLYLMPGLIDVHAHIGDGGIAPNTQQSREQALAQFVRYGVTSIFVPGGGGGNDERLAEWKSRCRGGELLCPRLFGSGDIITQYGSHPITTIWGLPADTDPAVIHQRGATAVREGDPIDPIMDQKLANGVDAIKIVVDDGPGAFAPKPRLSRAQIELIVASAHARGLRVFAHVSLAEHVDDVVAGGADGIMHSPDDRISGGTLRAMADRQVYYVATLSLFDALIDQEQGQKEQEEYAIQGVSQTALASLENEAYWSVDPESPESIAEWESALRDNLRRAHQAGVPIALGTDTNNPQIFPGYAVHEELKLMVDAGLQPQAALESATSTAAEFLGQQEHLGSLAPGFRADVIALRKNPLEDVLNTRTIEFVISNGTILEGVISN